jgi:hypothetical protein
LDWENAVLRWLAVPALAASLAFIGAAQAGDTRGGPIRTVLTVAEQPIPVDVTWLQSGGVVMLKIVSAKPLEPDERDKTLQGAQKLVDKFVGARAAVGTKGQLMMSFRMVGWRKPFTANDLTVGTNPAVPATGTN